MNFEFNNCKVKIFILDENSKFDKTILDDIDIYIKQKIYLSIQ